MKKKAIMLPWLVIFILMVSNYSIATTFLIELALFKGIAQSKIERLDSISLHQLIFSEIESVYSISEQARSLKEKFKLSAIQFLAKAKIIWHPKDEMGETIWEDFKRKNIVYPELTTKVLIGGKEYLIILTPFVTSITEKVRLEMKVYKDLLIQSIKNLDGLLISKETCLDSNKYYELLFKDEATTSWDTPIFLRLVSDGQIYFLSLYNAFILGSPVPGVIKY